VNNIKNIYSSNGVIYIKGYNGVATIINMAGQIVSETVVNGIAQIKLNSGIYSVVIEGSTTKVIVK
ncbi:MAG: hypothetical protein IKY54_02920, partial [Muribaculaceae bacterium]|nr:hypothetical protein [Muribaculaceae bacterium]